MFSPPESCGIPQSLGENKNPPRQKTRGYKANIKAADNELQEAFLGRIYEISDISPAVYGTLKNYNSRPQVLSTCFYLIR
jgi:hypothetical protein